MKYSNMLFIFPDFIDRILAHRCYERNPKIAK